MAPGPSLLAMHVIAQAKADLDVPALRADALAFLKGEADEDGEAALPFWCEVAGVDPLTVIAYVRGERDTLLETALHKVRAAREGAFVPLTAGELKEVQKGGAVFLGSGCWDYEGRIVVKEVRGGTPTTGASGEADDWDEDPASLGGGVQGFREPWEEAGETPGAEA